MKVTLVYQIQFLLFVDWQGIGAIKITFDDAKKKKQAKREKNTIKCRGLKNSFSRAIS